MKTVCCTTDEEKAKTDSKKWNAPSHQMAANDISHRLRLSHFPFLQLQRREKKKNSAATGWEFKIKKKNILLHCVAVYHLITKVLLPVGMKQSISGHSSRHRDGRVPVRSGPPKQKAMDRQKEEAVKFMSPSGQRGLWDGGEGRRIR